jgi:hypothetical protein
MIAITMGFAFEDHPERVSSYVTLEIRLHLHMSQAPATVDFGLHLTGTEPTVKRLMPHSVEASDRETPGHMHMFGMRGHVSKRVLNKREHYPG